MRNIVQVLSALQQMDPVPAFIQGELSSKIASILTDDDSSGWGVIGGEAVTSAGTRRKIIRVMEYLNSIS